MNFYIKAKSKSYKRRRSYFCFIYGLVISCITITIVNFYFQLPFTYFTIVSESRSLRLERNKLPSNKSSLIDSKMHNHVILVPMLINHFLDGSLLHLLDQFKGNFLILTNQELNIFVSVSGASEEQCSTIQLEIEKKNLDVNVDLNCLKDKLYKGININLSVAKLLKMYTSNVLVTIMDADDEFFPCTLFEIVELYRKSRSKLILHSFLTHREETLFNNICSSSKIATTYKGEYLYDLALQKDTSWLLENAHHGHHTTELSVFRDVKYGNGKRSQDSKFVRDVISHYGRKNITATFSDTIFTYYSGASEMWRKVGNDNVNNYLTHTFMGDFGNEIWQYLSLLGLSKRLNRHFCIHEIEGLEGANVLSKYFMMPQFLGKVFSNVEEFQKCPSFERQKVKILKEKFREFTFFKDQEAKILFIGGYLQHANYFKSYFSATSKLKIRETLLNASKNRLKGCKMWIGLHHRSYPESHNDVKLQFPESYVNVLSFFYNKNYCLFVSGNKKKETGALIAKSYNFTDKFDKVIFSESDFAEDFASLTLVDNLIISTGTFAYFAAVWNLHFNNKHQIHYHKKQQLLFGYNPVNKNISFGNWVAYP